MANKCTGHAATKDARRSDGALSLRKEFPISTNRITQQGDYYMGLAQYLLMIYRPSIRKEEHKTIGELFRKWV